MQQRALHPGAGQARVVQLRPVEARAAQVGTAQVGVLEVRVVEIAPGQAHAAQLGARAVGVHRPRRVGHDGAAAHHGGRRVGRRGHGQRAGDRRHAEVSGTCAHREPPHSSAVRTIVCPAAPPRPARAPVRHHRPAPVRAASPLQVVGELRLPVAPGRPPAIGALLRVGRASLGESVAAAPDGRRLPPFMRADRHHPCAGC